MALAVRLRWLLPRLRSGLRVPAGLRAARCGRRGGPGLGLGGSEVFPPPPPGWVSEAPARCRVLCQPERLRLLSNDGFRPPEGLSAPVSRLFLNTSSFPLSPVHSGASASQSFRMSSFLCSVHPNFYSKNLLFLGKSYLKLNNKKLAAFWLLKAKDYPAHTEEDKQVQKEAAQLLKSVGDKN
ncbi:regulator of microtubule dynamics protein 1 [Sarcophilus harrisii]